MIELRALGPIHLESDDGRTLHSVLAQPKRLALLLYLLLAHPRGHHPRDRLLALFWPELDEERARAALRQSIYYLRQSLGEQVIEGRADGAVAVRDATIRGDVLAFERLQDAGRPEEALELYRGELAEGLFVAGAPEVERWLEEERAKLRTRAMRAAWAASEAAERRGDVTGAIDHGRRALEVQPGQEASVRRLISLLDRQGDRAAALSAYEGFAALLREEYGAEPSAETRALVAAVREREQILAAAPSPPPSAPPRRSAPAVPARGASRKRALVVLALLGCAPALGWSLRAVYPGQEGYGSIAVLPFASLDGDEASRYMGAGLTEELTHALAGSEGLRVAARTSAEAARAWDLDVRQIGEKLGVETVLEGSVRREGDRVHIVAQLIDASSGYHLWSRKYDGRAEEILTLEETITADLLRSLRPRQGRRATGSAIRPSTRDPEAYRAYLMGRYAWGQRTRTDLQRAVGHFEEAVRRDPAFARAHAGLADALALLPEYGGALPGEAFPAAKGHALRALSLDPSLADAHLSLAMIHENYEWDWAGAEREYERAIELDPDHPIARAWYADRLVATGRERQAIREIRRAQRLDPLSLPVNANVAKILYFARRPDAAVAAAREALELEPDFGVARFWLALALEQLGRHEEAIRELETAAVTPDRRAALGHIHAVSGREPEARAILAELVERSRLEFVSPYRIALIHVALGERARAFEWLERAYEARDLWLVFLRVDPLAAPLRSDPRFDDLAARMGIAP